jgi:hypothetical protein
VAEVAVAAAVVTSVEGEAAEVAVTEEVEAEARATPSRRGSAQEAPAADSLMRAEEVVEEVNLSATRNYISLALHYHIDTISHNNT